MKEMISEEDCNNIKKTGTLETEKSQKRSRDLGESLEELSAKRCRVEGPPRLDEGEDDDLIGEEEEDDEDEGRLLIQAGGGENKGDASMDGEEDSNDSDSNDNSDASQNGLPSSNQYEEETPETRGEGGSGGFVEETDENSQEDHRQEEEDEESSDLKKCVSRLKEYVNGDVFPRRGSSGGGESSDRVVARIKSEESGETVVQRFEKEISDLRTLLLLKEREWNSILKLVKLKEITLAQLKRKKEVEGILESRVPVEGGDDYLHKLLTQIAAESIRTGSSAVHVQNSINETEKEIKDLGKQASTNFIHTHNKGDGVNTSSDAENFFLASNALKNLVNKNKTTLTSHSIPAVPNTPTTTTTKVIGEGRQGPIVDVTSLIADYRSKTQAENVERKKQRNASGTVPIYPPLNQSANISFSDILGTLLKKAIDKDKDPHVTPTIVSTKSLSNAKVKGSATPNNSNSGGTPKTPMATTLAKLLSSNNVSTSRSSSEEALSFNKAPSNSNAANSDKNLSLANLLASSKARDDTQKKKTESQTVPLCQGCNANKAQFVCAGCANQWYCSRECQVAAWDEHSEVCSG